ncbi:MAG: CO dehydrogenase/acetyl-CoA synthase subunit delta [Methanosarcinales archaeon]|nr:CO dehydrogenase/acetyl-CoA synthase subunit delta [Methanosarcinales archaeon]
MEKKLTLADLARILEQYDVVELEDVTIKGEVELELGSSAGLALPPALAQALQSLMGAREMPGTLEAKRIEALLPATFKVAKAEWTGKIEEVTIGATSADGGTRERTVTIGGEKSLPFYNFDAKMPHPPVISVDCFDMPIPLARAVREYYEDVMEDPGEWAKKNVREFGADMVTIHLISTDPTIKDTPARAAAKTVEEVLQAVKVPIVIGGSGNPDKDPEVLEAAAEAAEGERCLIASANLNMDYERIAKAALKHGHVILSWTQLDINAQKTLNRYLFKLGVPREDIVIDPTTAALGYGLDYAFTNIERMRISALKGDTDLAFPISCGITNAWGAREAWMKDSPSKEDSDWGPAAYRGQMYEIITGLTLGLAGGDMFMMMHPNAASTVKKVTQTLFGAKVKEDKAKRVAIEDWVTWDAEVGALKK